jgi:hypothetical protein
MNKALFGLALINHNWERENKDIIDSYIPLLCSIIKSKGYSNINREKICEDIKANYGIEMTLGAIEGILKRMLGDNLLKRDKGEYGVDFNKVCDKVKNNFKDEFDLLYTDLITQLQNYSQQKFNIEFTTEDCDNGIISFFKEYDVSILFAENEGISILPVVKESKKIKYVIANFILYAYEKNKKIFANVVKLAKGYSIASLITYSDFQSYTGTMESVDIFLDAPLIFSLMGLNGESNLKLSQELIKELDLNKARLNVFEVNYNEVVGTIEEAIQRLRSGKNDLRYSSRVLRTAVRENISANELQIKLTQLEQTLKRFKISVVPIPPSNNPTYIIDENKLRETIKVLYSKDGGYISQNRLDQIDNDVISISAIFRLRKSTHAVSLKNCKALLITNNEQIAYAAKKHEREDWYYKSAIPTCVTDILLSTILWANYPRKNENLNVRRLMSECYYMMDIDSKILGRYYNDVERMHKENQITDDQYYMLTASNLAYNLLEKKTFNDFEVYTDKTAAEILEDIQLDFSRQADEQRTRNELVDSNLKRISCIVAKSIFFILFIGLAVVAILFKIKSKWIFDKWYLDVIYYLFAGLIASFGFLRWSNWIPSRERIEKKLTDLIFNWITRILTKKSY